MFFIYLIIYHLYESLIQYNDSKNNIGGKCMKLFNVSYMQDNYDGSYLTVGDDSDTPKTIEERELKSSRWADEEVILYSLHAKEVTEIEGYRVSISPKTINNNELDTTTRKINEWTGCSIVNISPAIKDMDGNYLSDRKTSDIILVTNKFDVITVEDWNKWYSLYYLTMTDDYEPVLVSFTFGDIIDGVDHYYYPESIVKFAKVNNLKIDLISYIAICKMYMEDADCMVDEIPDEVLPTIEDLEEVLTNASGICTAFYLHHKYDTSVYRNYVKKNN